MERVRTAVAVCAHPDDLEYFCGGTIRAMADDGWHIGLVIATDGDRGTHDPAASSQLVASTRREEAMAAAWILGVSHVEFLGHEDGELSTAASLRAELTRIYRSMRPERLITFDPWKRYELHPDHREIGMAAIDARLFARLPHFHPEHLRDGLAPWTISEILLFNTDEPDYFVDVSRTIEAKLEALRAHTSQWEGIWPQTSGAVRAEAARMGALAGAAAAEGFKRLYVPLGPVSAGWSDANNGPTVGC
jgi:LmbE family N-acetylglucosaminyl deacetylase